jgi:hypothetical protein
VIAVPLTEDSLREAFRRLRDFKSVHTGEEYPREAWRILEGSLGLDERMKEVVLEEVADVFHTSEDDDDHFLPGLLAGIMLGLIAADHAKEST